MVTEEGDTGAGSPGLSWGSLLLRVGAGRAHGRPGFGDRPGTPSRTGLQVSSHSKAAVALTEGALLGYITLLTRGLGSRRGGSLAGLTIPQAVRP